MKQQKQLPNKHHTIEGIVAVLTVTLVDYISLH